MCIIIDANRLGTFLSDHDNEDAAPIRNWLNRLGGRIVYSTDGAFARELGPRTRTTLQTLCPGRQGAVGFGEPLCR